MTDATVTTPISQTEQSGSSETFPPLEVAKRCLDAVEAYRKSERKSIDKGVTSREVIEALSSTTPEFSKSEFNDSLRNYLSML
jgi:hypothetical protein